MQYSYQSDTSQQREQRGRQEKREDKSTSNSKKRKYRWGTASKIALSTPSLPTIDFIPDNTTIEQEEAMLIRFRIDEITRKLLSNDIDMDFFEEDRSPSPVYDKDGKRVNTKDQRAKDKLNEERGKLVEIAQLIWPLFRPPPDFQASALKKQRIIYIPVEKYPDYNFIGLIIGPRGNTQKMMEKETGAKISIRGKGSMKDGKKNPFDDEPLQVLIQGDNDVQIERASKLVHSLLVPVDETRNEHKRKQLRELAAINGTLKDKLWMTTVNESEEFSFDRASVKCKICGEVSHPTMDCPLKSKGTAILNNESKELDDEYEKFLVDIGEKKQTEFVNTRDSPQRQDEEEPWLQDEEKSKPQTIISAPVLRNIPPPIIQPPWMPTGNMPPPPGNMLPQTVRPPMPPQNPWGQEMPIPTQNPWGNQPPPMPVPPTVPGVQPPNPWAQQAVQQGVNPWNQQQTQTNFSWL